MSEHLEENPWRKVFPRQQCASCGRMANLHADDKCRNCWRMDNGDDEAYEDD
jgi:hypothetical protein